MAAPAPVSTSLNLYGVLSETKRIVNSHSRHFLALAVLFLLPLSFSLIIYPTLSQSQSNHHRTVQVLLRRTPPSSHHFLEYLAIPLAFSLSILLLSLSATATITYSTFYGFYGRPVKLASAIKSLSRSFFPMLITAVASQTLYIAVGASFGFLLFFFTKALDALGFEINYQSYYFQGLCYMLLVILILIILYLQVNWLLAFVIVVVESKWGFEPLRRSSYLVKGMRPTAFALLFIFGWIIWFFLWADSIPSYANFSDASECLRYIVGIVLGSSFVTFYMLYNVASTTVLYMCCKAKHGELAWDIAEEFAREYVSLPFHDAKLPHVVYVVDPY